MVKERFKQIKPGIFELPKEGIMNVPARIYASPKMLEQIEDSAVQQLVNTASLKGIQKYAMALPDMHWGYGFPVGGVAAMDAHEGVVSPGGVGYDVNCLKGNTKISVGEETKKIKDFKISDLGSTIRSVKKNKVIDERIRALMKFHKKETIFEIVTKQGRKISATHDHPFFTLNGKINAGDLQVDENILVVENNKLITEKIDEIKRRKFDDFVYDFTIDKTHNFIANGFVVSNCGVRLIKTNLTENDLRPKLKELMDELYKSVPSGVGEKGKVRLTPEQLDEVLVKGSEWAVENNYAWKEDLLATEEGGKVNGADPNKVSNEAKKRGRPQLGTLGSGNHFLEVQKIGEVFDERAAKNFGLEKDQVTIMIHCGSRGLGHQVASDFIRIMDNACQKYGTQSIDRQLNAVPITSPEGQDYLKAMNSAVNYAFCNRQIITHFTRESFAKVFGQRAEELQMDLVYDVAHNIAKFENHDVNGKQTNVLIHRKGATRAFPAGRMELKGKFREIGQPAIIPGSMGTSSYVVMGTDVGLLESFGTVNHGAGRVMSRHAAMAKKDGKQVKLDLEAKGEEIRVQFVKGLAEEMPEAYKDIDEVIRSVELAGLGKKVTKHIPLGVMKG